MSVVASLGRLGVDNNSTRDNSLMLPWNCPTDNMLYYGDSGCTLHAGVCNDNNCLGEGERCVSLRERSRSDEHMAKLRDTYAAIHCRRAT